MGILDSILGGGGDDDGYMAAMNNIAKNRLLLDSIDLPKYLDYVPEEYKYELIQEDPELRATQMAGLKKMAGLAEEGLTAEDELAFSKARDMAQQERKRATAASMENAMARGVGGSGLEFATKEMANQGAIEDANNMGMQRAATRANNKVLYNNAFMQNAGNIRGQDMNANSANTGIINQFNQMNTNNKNQATQYNNDMKQRNFDNEMSRTTGQINLNNQANDAEMANSAAIEKKKKATMGAIGAGVGAMYGGAQGAGVGYSVGSSI